MYYSLYDRLLLPESLHRAFRKVNANKGKPGVDGQTVEAFAQDLSGEIVMLVRELRDKSYRPHPVKRVEILKDKVRKITRRNSPVNLVKVIEDLNPVLRGFANYFKAANCKKVFSDLAQWIRRRLRAKQLRLWKKPKRLHRRLRQLGYKGEFMQIKMNSWCNSASPLTNYALPNDYFRELGLYDLSRVRTAATASSKRG